MEKYDTTPKDGKRKKKDPRKRGTNSSTGYSGTVPIMHDEPNARGQVVGQSVGLILLPSLPALFRECMRMCSASSNSSDLH